MEPMNEIETGLWLGGAPASKDMSQLKAHSITHILSLNMSPLHVSCRQGFQYCFIEVLDSMEADLLGHFQKCFDFIDHALSSGGAILVHCVVGVSRSATIVTAYIMYKKKISYKDALQLVKSKRSCISPNPNFRNQLKIFQAMGNHIDPQFPAYRRYCLYHMAQRCQNAESVQEGIKVESFSSDPSTFPSDTVVYKCRKCRRALFHEACLLPHPDKEEMDRAEAKASDESFLGVGPEFDTEEREEMEGREKDEKVCSRGQLFVEPVEWMRVDLHQMEGKLACPKCQCKIGSFTWVGEPCICGQWVCPAFRIASNRVDKCQPRGANSIPGVIKQLQESSVAPVT